MKSNPTTHSLVRKFDGWGGGLYKEGGVSIGWGVRCDASTRQTNRRSSSIFIALSTRKKRKETKKQGTGKYRKTWHNKTSSSSQTEKAGKAAKWGAESGALKKRTK